VIQLAGVHDVNKAAQIIGTTAQLQFFDLEEDVTGPSKDPQQGVVATSNLFNLLKQVEPDTKKGKPTAYYLFNQKKQPVAGPEDSTEKLLNSTLPGKEGKPGKKLTGEVPAGFTMLAVPNKTTVITCDTTTGCPDGRDRLLPLQVRPAERDAPGPGGDGRGPEAFRDPGRHRDGQRGKHRSARLHRRGRRQVPRDHACRGNPRGECGRGRRADGQRPQHRPPVRAALRDRAGRSASVDAVHRLQAEPGRD
jgi:hypothetical protein